MKYTIKKIDLSNGAKETYTSFYYKRGVELVYEVTTNGFSCVARVQSDLNIEHYYYYSARTLPKYIAESCEYITEEFTVGYEFNNGDCKPCKIELIQDNKYYYRVEDMTCLYILDLEDLKHTIWLGKENAAYRAKCIVIEDEREAREAKDLEQYNDIDGFASSKSAMQLGKIRSTLNSHVRLEGVVYTVKDAIKMLLNTGYKVDKFSYWSVKCGFYKHKPCIRNREINSLYDGRWITKTALDYATYLLSRDQA